MSIGILPISRSCDKIGISFVRQISDVYGL